MTHERIPVNRNFYIDELVDPVTYFTEQDHGLSKIDPSLIDIVQLLRDLYGKPIGINNWWHHLPENLTDPIAFLQWCEGQRGVYVWSGLRTTLCKIGAKASAHKLGKAIDPKGPQNIFFGIVKENAQRFYDLGLRRLEDPAITNGWLHMDTEERNCKPDSIRVIDITKCTQIIRFKRAS